MAPTHKWLPCTCSARRHPSRSVHRLQASRRSAILPAAVRRIAVGTITRQASGREGNVADCCPYGELDAAETRSMRRRDTQTHRCNLQYIVPV